MKNQQISHQNETSKEVIRYQDTIRIVDQDEISITQENEDCNENNKCG